MTEDFLERMAGRLLSWGERRMKERLKFSLVVLMLELLWKFDDPLVLLNFS